MMNEDELKEKIKNAIAGGELDRVDDVLEFIKEVNDGYVLCHDGVPDCWRVLKEDRTQEIGKEPVIMPMGGKFENMKAFLARIAEDEEVLGFCGAVLKRTGKMKRISFNITIAQMAFAGAMLIRDCTEEAGG